MSSLHRYVSYALIALAGLVSPAGFVSAQEDFKNRPTSRQSAPSDGRRVIPSGTLPVVTAREPQRPAQPIRRGQTGTPDSIQAAREFFTLTGIPAFYDRQVQSILQQQLRDNPELRPYSDILRDFLERHASWRAISEDLTVFLADSFEERELRQLNAFATTDAGRKLFSNLELFARADLTPEKLRRLFDEVELKQIEVFSRTAVFQKFAERIPAVFEAGARVVNERIDRHAGELTEAIQRRQQRRWP
ncbi:MAG: hypothetical protein NZ585_05220 [Chloracidobacterium sp.]|nr:hypothetical protein [Chloracidobacterium sp.]MDW8216905.1 hypothetical protein [Acidobacteriota bacterium]